MSLLPAKLLPLSGFGVALAGVAAGREATGRDAGRAGAEGREGVRDGVEAVGREGVLVPTKGGLAGGVESLGVAGAFASLAGTAGPCRCGLAVGLAGLGRPLING